MSDSEHTRKKAKVGDASPIAPLEPLSYSAAKRQDLRAAFAAAKPFPHLTVPILGDDAFMRTVREEIISNLKADYKETDIFKVLQTKDLGNLESSDQALQSLLKLRDAIYSADFRSFIQGVTGCPPLTEQVDCSCNIYPKGGHLLCHDDVIGSRCVSYIVYLTDPDSEWQEGDGGALELYSIGDNHQPECDPSRRILPKWNQMVFFRTEPDVSFHAVEEVHTAENHRLSISGWFHTSPEHVETSRSSLSQLQSNVTRATTTFTFSPEEHGDALPEEDVEFLKKWVRATYLDHTSIDKVYQMFRKEGSIQLRDFLNEQALESITSLIESADSEARGSIYGAPNSGWSVMGPPHKQRYMQAIPEGDPGDSAMQRMSQALSQIEKDVFQSPSFRRLLHQLTGIDTMTAHSEVRCFRPGSDYTIAVYDQTKQDTLDAVLCFVQTPTEDAGADADADEGIDKHPDEEADADKLLDKDADAYTQWSLGEVGGFEAYLLADTHEKEAADVYRVDDEDSGVLSVNPMHNTLNLVLADQGLIKFVKYVSATAPGCRWDISAEYIDAQNTGPDTTGESESGETSSGSVEDDEESSP